MSAKSCFAVGCMAIIFGIGISILGYGSYLVHLERKEFAAGTGTKGTCVIDGLGGLVPSCYVNSNYISCETVFSMNYYVQNKTTIWNQVIPFGGDGLDPTKLKPGDIIPCYSLNFNDESYKVVAWKRTYFSTTTLVLFIGSLAFTLLLTCCTISAVAYARRQSTNVYTRY
jgi:hypothetical protein